MLVPVSEKAPVDDRGLSLLGYEPKG
jgi:hypothetical protein